MLMNPPEMLEEIRKEIINDKEKKYYPSNDKGEKIILNPGDMLIYKGAEFEHWREPLQGSACVQLFIHFVEDKKENVEYFYDSRPFIGLADVFKKPGIKR